MGKKKDYTKFSEPSKETENETIKDVVVEAVAEAVEEAVSEITEEVLEEVVVEAVVEAVAEVKEEVKAKEPVIKGIVVNCKKLNVRKEPNAQADAVFVIDENQEVIIDNTFDSTFFYKVYGTKSNKMFNGYCMKQFIQIK